MANNTNQGLYRGYGLKSVAGPRELNEDSAFVKEYISRARQQRYTCMAAVADGMGGHQAGEVASSTAVQSLFEEFNAQKIAYDRDENLDTRQLLYHLFSLVNTTVYDIAKRDNKLKGMGTTLTAFLAERDKAFIAHVGDSRAYLIRGGSISQLTEDHTLVQDMVRDKIITREQAEARSDRNVITRAIGVDPTVEVDMLSIPIQADDMILLCSDGLYDVVTNHEILITLSQSINMQAACQDLVQLALQKGASDNVTAAAWAVPALTQAQAAAARPADQTLVLPPERGPSDTMVRAPQRKGQTNKALVAAILVAVTIAGFVLGWLIAGWVKGGGGEDQGQETAAEGAVEEGEQTAGGPGALRGETTVRILSAVGSDPGLADEAYEILQDMGYKEVLTGQAFNDTELMIYCLEDGGDKADLVEEDLGLENCGRSYEVGNEGDATSKYNADVVVVLNGDWYIPKGEPARE